VHTNAAFAADFNGPLPLSLADRHRLFRGNDVWLAAEGAYSACMDRGAAARTPALKQLPAHRAVLPADGIGRLAVQGISGRDIPLLQGTVLFSTLVVILGNLLADCLYSVLDPRVRKEG
jgi:hypothetical protein